jgi:uncharacterized protein YndB with AHSA1/START domain
MKKKPVKTKSSPAGRPHPKFLITRDFKVSRELIFDAWTDPNHLSQWWGPHGFKTLVCQWEPRSGTDIYLIMRSMGGVEYPVGGRFVDAAYPYRLAFTTGLIDRKEELMFELSHQVNLEATKNRTRLEIRSELVKTRSPESGKYIQSFEESMKQSLERLDECLSDLSRREITGEHIVAAEPESILNLLNEKGHAINWWGQKGSKIAIEKFDFRPQGMWNSTISAVGKTPWQSQNRFLETAKPLTVIIHHLEPAPRFVISFILAKINVGTKVKWRMFFESAGECAKAKHLPSNWAEFDPIRFKTYLNETFNHKLTKKKPSQRAQARR